MDPSGFNTGRAVAVPLVPRQGVVFGKAAAAGKPGAGTAEGKVVAGPGSGTGSGPSRNAFKGGRPGSQVNNAETEQHVNNRKPSPTRVRKAAPVAPHPPVKQNSGGIIVSDVELQREANAKAQRLLRFSQGQEFSDTASQPNGGRVSGKTEHGFPYRETRQSSQSSKPAADSAQNDRMETEALGDDFSNTEAIVGTCDDMCSETERHERERKGDLDKFERVDGDRNLTSVDLAVKKYTRTPSRESHLIRPLPVLQTTMNYLLTLINQGYDDERLLRLHSFLWDRMRAVRMDLRMQHIFNREAITMHEQMIRFHILAMHELCQYKKGEGFNEGFDAHLNIEQMNKASVDLFEMYDDHRKRGILVETEAEFRGYYALLKLDKHPGYSVEPAELSLDLAKMTPEMRNTPQVLFAREVARACRGGNYIAFFRLARKATYLQACLMHAHFAKLRTEALAILHSGLQKNQGVPITEVVKWLGMEGEDIEGLVEYHGFSLKPFEKIYVVKDGPFLNRDAEYQARRSRLVETKRSSSIVQDVEGKGQQQAVVDSWSATPTTPGTQEEEMPDYEEDDLPFPAETPQTSPARQHWTTALGRSSPDTGQGADDMRISPPYKAISPPKRGQANLSISSFDSKTLPLWPTPQKNHLVLNSSTENLSPQRGRKRESYPGRLTQDIDLKEGNKKLVTAGGAIDVEPEEEEVELPERGPTVEEIRAQRVLEWEVEKEVEREKERERERRKRATEEAEAAAAKWAAKLAADAEMKRQQQEEERLAANRAEASAGKKRLWLRRWKRRAAIMAEEKLRRKIRAEAALSSLSVGPPLAGFKSEKDGALIPLANGGPAPMSIDQVARMRSEKIREMWKPLDVLSLVRPLFEHKFPSTKFITFKLLLAVGDTDSSNMAGQWLSNKLSNSQVVFPEIHSDGRTPGLWFEALNVDERMKANQEVVLHGASGLVFLVRKGHSVIEERARLHSLVETLPVGIRLPLLLLYSPREHYSEAETEKLKASLGLYDFEGLRIGWQNVSPVSSSNDGGLYSDEFLRGGLVWLANSASSQPNLRPIHVRELVTNNLDGHCKILMASSSSNVTPDRCISIFNHSLRSAAMEIRKAVSAAPAHWPPGEAESVVSHVLPGILPQQGWNEPDLLDPIHQALHLAELPRFPTIEQVKPGSPTSAWENVRYQKAAVERAMQQYLARIDGIKEDDSVLVRQAQLMVQRNSSLEWTESGRVLVPRWASIFQGIYQTRLLLLNSEPPPTVYIISKGDEEVERPLELDEVEQQVPFASEIAAGTPFGRTRHVNLMFDDTEEQEARTTLQEKLSLAKSYTDRLNFDDYESKTPVKQQASPEQMDEDMPAFVVQGNTWSIFSPSLESWQRRQPVSLKKRRLSLSPESAVQSPATNLHKSLASTSSTATTSFSDLWAPGFDGSSPLETDKGHGVSGPFGISRLPEELLLENTVIKLNNDVDRVLRRASSDMCFADTQIAADFNSEGAFNKSRFHFDRNMLFDRTADSAVGKPVEPGPSTISGAIGSIDDMLERCWRAQKSIDRKLEDSFGILHDGLRSNR